MTKKRLWVQRDYRKGVGLLIFLFLSGFEGAIAIENEGEGKPRWWRGNLHAHSLWSAQDTYPEIAAHWYEENGYNFLLLSDHNILMRNQKWIHPDHRPVRRRGEKTLADYIGLMGPEWVEQRERVGQPMVAILFDPNLSWSRTAEEMAEVEELRLFELHNGHPGTNTYKDELWKDTERMWDIALTLRFAEHGFCPLNGVAADDTHQYHGEWGPRTSSPGRGWVRVRGSHLTPESIVRGLEHPPEEEMWMKAWTQPVVPTANNEVAQEGRLTIVVDSSPFPSVKEAARAEREVDWSEERSPAVRACTESFAAMELRRFLAEALQGVDVDEIVFRAPDGMPDGDVIVLGSGGTNELLSDGKPLPEDPEAFRVRAGEEDGRVVTRIIGGGRQGVLYGVYAYLEQLGYRFFGMGEEGIVYPKEREGLPLHLDLDESPDFHIRGFMTGPRGGDLEDFFVWMARNRFNLWSAFEEEESIPLLKKLGLRLNGGLHWIQPHYLSPEAEYPYRLPWEEPGEVDKPATPYRIDPAVRERLEEHEGEGRPGYFDVHPEWYGLVDGERSPDVGWRGVNYCTSNIDATAELSRNLLVSLAEGRLRHADVLEFWMVDDGRWCECDDCRAEGSYTDRLLLTTHRVNEALQAGRVDGRLKRDVHVSTLAYLETVEPPKRQLPEDFDYDSISVTFFPFRRCYAHGLGDPQCREINGPIREAFEGWVGEGRLFRGSLRIGEYYNLSSYQSQPFVFSQILEEDIPYYYESGVRHFHFMHVLHSNWGPWALNHRLLSRALWSHDGDLGKWQADFLEKYYPTTHRKMEEFYRALEVATANIASWKARVDTVDGVSYDLREWLREEKNGIFGIDHLGYEPGESLSTSISEMADYTAAARRHLNRALAVAEKPVEVERLRDVDGRFAYGEAVMHFYRHLVRATRAHRQQDTSAAREEVRKLSRWVQKLQAMEGAAQVSGGDANSPSAFIATGARPQYNRLKELYGASGEGDLFDP